MNLSFEPTSAHMQLSSNFGMTLSFALKLKPTSRAFGLTSGLELRDCMFDLTVHPISQSPYEVKLKEDGRLGEFRSFLARPTKKDSLYMLWVHVNDDQFNTLYAEISKGNLPTDMDIGVDDDNEQLDGLMEGVYDDASIGGSPLALRSFLFTLRLAGPNEKVTA